MKVLHYFWDGGKMPRLERECIASWSRIMPDCEVKGWNLEQVGRLVEVEAAKWMECPFVKGAIAAKQWGFVIDVVRWVVLYYEGGVFLDADVEMVKPLPAGTWLAAETDNPLQIAPGLGAAFPPKHPFVKAMLEEYMKISFDPKHTLRIASPYVVTRVWKRYGEGIEILPAKVMNPLGWSGGKLGKIGEETCAIHWYAAHWFNWKQRLVYQTFPRMGIDIGKIIRWFRR